jgi:NAD(P)-dependent dehydrogenase (short-subunit alcohol dehydrogenase family)
LRTQLIRYSLLFVKGFGRTLHIAAVRGGGGHMSCAVITGSTRGIGFGLAENFLRRGWQVVINGRSSASVDAALENLTAGGAAAGALAGLPGNVTSRDDMEALFALGTERFGAVNIWVNNAGVGQPYLPVWELPEETVRQVIDIDFYGLTIASSVAIRGMIRQGHGHIYNMEGFGSNGRIGRGNISVYGAAKRALRFLSRAMAAELKRTPVKLSRISPGMVATEFISGQYADDPAGFEAAKKIFNILADRVETVTPWLVDKMIQNRKHDALFEWLTTGKVLFRFMTAGFRKNRDVFSPED